LEEPVPGWESPSVLTPDDIMAGALPTGVVIVFDDDHYYMGGVIAERLRSEGYPVTLVTPASEVSTWTRLTEEQYRIQQRLVTLDIEIKTGNALQAIGTDHAVIESIYDDTRTQEVDATTVVMVTSRLPRDILYHELVDQIIVDRIGDCLAPGTIATAVYSGHKYAREIDTTSLSPVSFLRDTRRV